MTTDPRSLPTPDLISVAAPAAGANFVFTNSQGELVLVRAVTFVLTTSATVANRFVGLKVTADTRTVMQVGSMVAQVASLTRNYCAYTGTQSTADSPSGMVLPWRDSGILLRPGYQLSSVITGIDAGDTVTGVTLDVLRFSPQYDPRRPPYVGDYVIATEE